MLQIVLVSVSIKGRVVDSDVYNDMKKTRLEEGECIISYDVSSLLTSIPVTSAVDIIKNKLEQT